MRAEYIIPLDSQSGSLVLSLESENKVINHSVDIKQIGAHGNKSFLIEIRRSRIYIINPLQESKSQSFNISVVARYKSGDPVEGIVQLKINLVENSTKSGSLPPVKLERGHKIIPLIPDHVKQALGLKHEDTLAGREIKVEAKIEAHLEKGDGEIKKHTVVKSEAFLVTFVDQSYVLEFSLFNTQFFKPGLSYKGHIMLRTIDQFLQNSLEKQEITLTVLHDNSLNKKSVKEKYLVTPNTWFEFTFPIPKDDVRLELEATFEDQVSEKSVKDYMKEMLPFSTWNANGHYIQISMDKKPVYVGQPFRVKVESTFPTSEVFYQVFSQAALVHSDKFVALSPATTHDLPIVLPQNISHALSSCSFAAEVLSPNKEIIADSLQFVVEHKQEVPLELLMKPESFEKGNAFEVTVQARPFVTVYLVTIKSLLAVDSEEQEIRERMARDKMEVILRNLKNPGEPSISEIAQKVPSSLAPDSQRVLDDSKCLLITDGFVFVDQNKKWPLSSSRKAWLDEMQQSSFVEEFDSDLWNVNVTVGSTGKEKLQLILPEEARLYTLGCFAVIPGIGLVVSESIQFKKEPSVMPPSKPALSMDKNSSTEESVTGSLDEKAVIDDPSDDDTLIEDEDNDENILRVGVVDYSPSWLTSPSSVSALPKGMTITVRCENREETLQMQRRTQSLLPFSTSNSLRGQELLWNHNEEELVGFYEGDKVKGIISLKKLNEFQEKLYLLEFKCGGKLHTIEPWSGYLNTAPGLKRADMKFELMNYATIHRVLHLQYRKTVKAEYMSSTPSTGTTSSHVPICNSTCRQTEPVAEEQIYKWINFAGNIACFIILILLAWIVLRTCTTASGETKN